MEMICVSCSSCCYRNQLVLPSCSSPQGQGCRGSRDLSPQVKMKAALGEAEDQEQRRVDTHRAPQSSCPCPSSRDLG